MSCHKVGDLGRADEETADGSHRVLRRDELTIMSYKSVMGAIDLADGAHHSKSLLET